MTDVDEWIETLPAGRRVAVHAVVALLRTSIQSGFDEQVESNMLTYTVPLSVSGPTYNRKPLQFAALASQKSYLALYLSAVYAEPDLAVDLDREFGRAGKKLDIGKSCIRFRSFDDLAAGAVAAVLGRHDPASFTEVYNAARSRR
jgi:hypothetical protein